MPTFCDKYLSACRKFFLFIFYVLRENFNKNIWIYLKNNKYFPKKWKFIKSLALIEGLRLFFAFSALFEGKFIGFDVKFSKFW